MLCVASHAVFQCVSIYNYPALPSPPTLPVECLITTCNKGTVPLLLVQATASGY